jgi:molybdopterin/thiamine biosynthesis adenylyltransferase
MRGAALASCLGASAVFRAHLGRETSPRVLSAWNYAEFDDAALGPEDIPILDVGRLLMVGAGAVGAATAYWARALGADASLWTIVDGDIVKLHNTNRSMVYTARDAGWPDQRPTKKAERLSAAFPRSTPVSEWYHLREDLHEGDYDVILALANDYDVREMLAHRNAPITLQATTGNNWTSQLHRHILGVDDCVSCRTGEIHTPQFGCSTVSVGQADRPSNDAALPFLSAASGLMLVTALQRLQLGALDDGANRWSWDFESSYRMTATPGVCRCRDNCSSLWPAAARRTHNIKSRWAALDVAATRRA